MKTPIKFAVVLMAFMSLSTVFSTTFAQSTEGKDFWVTFLQADQDDNNKLTLSLSISSRHNCQVTISNPFTNYSETVTVAAGGLQIVEIYKDGNVLAGNARSAMTTTGKICYAVNSEKVDTCALHVTSTEDISLFATNYKKATFDATNVIPTASLKSDYVIQTYTPSDHGGTGSTQGSHFAIIAAEDNTVVEYSPTVPTKSLNDSINAAKTYAEFILGSNGNDSTVLPANILYWLRYKMGETMLQTPVLKKGQVYYVWTGKADGAAGDLSGTVVQAKDGKKIAVFQGCPHTNIPYKVKQRDHIFSQAMPTSYWGNTFALTASMSRKRDIIRVMALDDGTEVRINGNVVHTFNFAQDTKHYWEFEIGEAYGSLAAPTVNGKSCLLTTSCPCAVHLFMVSQQYDGDKNNNGDPAMLWINPIEQQIDEITFATFASSNGTTYNYTNVVTDKPALMTLDGNDIANQFQQVSGSNQYYFAQLDLTSVAGTHTLKSNGSNFIAHVYGFTENESYGYSAGGATVPLEQYITINGEIFSPTSDNSLCGIDTVHFACDLNYEVENITWNFGDGTPMVSGKDKSAVDHYYAKGGIYPAYVLIERSSSNLCVGKTAVDSIPIKVNVGRLEVVVDSIVDLTCKEDRILMYYTNNSGISLDGDKCTFDFSGEVEGNPFTLNVTKQYFEVKVAEGTEQGIYHLNIYLNTECGKDTLSLPFGIAFDPNKLLLRRWDDVMGLSKSALAENNLAPVKYQWYKNGEEMEGQNGPTLSLSGETDFTNEYHVCMWMEDDAQICTCPTKFNAQGKTETLTFENDINVSALSVAAGSWIYVSTIEAGTASIYRVDGTLLQQYDLAAGGGNLYFDEAGLYIVKVKAGKAKQNFKIFAY